ncbi:unnamed protein product, partial [Rotaria sp. Silwood1]
MTSNSNNLTTTLPNISVQNRSRSFTVSTEPGRESMDENVSSFDGQVQIVPDGL